MKDYCSTNYWKVVNFTQLIITNTYSSAYVPNQGLYVEILSSLTL